MIVPENIQAAVFTDEYFDLKGLSVYSKMAVSTLRGFIRDKGLPCYKLPGASGNAGKILVKRSEFDTWMGRYTYNSRREIRGMADEMLAKIRPDRSDT